MRYRRVCSGKKHLIVVGNIAFTTAVEWKSHKGDMQSCIRYHRSELTMNFPVCFVVRKKQSFEFPRIQADFTHASLALEYVDTLSIFARELCDCLQALPLQYRMVGCSTSLLGSSLYSRVSLEELQIGADEAGFTTRYRYVQIFGLRRVSKMSVSAVVAVGRVQQPLIRQCRLATHLPVGLAIVHEKLQSRRACYTSI